MWKVRAWPAGMGYSEPIAIAYIDDSEKELAEAIALMYNGIATELREPATVERVDVEIREIGLK